MIAVLLALDWQWKNNSMINTDRLDNKEENTRVGEVLP